MHGQEPLATASVQVFNWLTSDYNSGLVNIQLYAKSYILKEIG